MRLCPLNSDLFLNAKLPMFSYDLVESEGRVFEAGTNLTLKLMPTWPTSKRLFTMVKVRDGLDMDFQVVCFRMLY